MDGVGIVTKVAAEQRLRDGTLAEPEDSVYARFHEEVLDDGAAGDAVADAIADEGCAGDETVGEIVGVVPQAVGPFELAIDEAGGWGPFVDAAAPVDGQAVEAEAVVDEGPGVHGDRAWRENVKVQPRRRDGFEIAGIRKEREDGFAREGQGHLDIKGEDAHGG